MRDVQRSTTLVNGSNVEVLTDVLYWGLTCNRSLVRSGSFFDQTPVLLVALNAEILVGIVSTITSSGIIGFYVGIVLAVGRFLRIALSNLSHKPIYEDMADCDELLSFCQDIYMAREDNDLFDSSSFFLILSGPSRPQVPRGVSLA